jgi:phosphoribosylanthranilate isomerase
MRIKICGIACEEDVRALVPASPDYAGFLVGLDYPADDAVSPEEARRLAALLPRSIVPVLVTHRAEVGAVLDLAGTCGFSTIQLHGAFPLDRIPELRRAVPGASIWRVVHVEGAGAVSRAAEVARVADAVLLDTRTASRIGGTGQVHDWAISAEIVRSCGKPVVLAGGLTPKNVADAVRTVRPWAVDVNSGVEDAQGRKDRKRLGTFLFSFHFLHPKLDVRNEN